MPRTWIPVLVLAIITAACTGADREVARVGDMTIRIADVEALNSDADSVPAEVFRQDLLLLIAREALTQALEEDFGASVDAERVESEFQALMDQIEASGLPIEEVMGRPGATEAHVRFNAYMVTLSEQARDGVASDEPTLRQALAGGVEVTTVCARHILVATQEEAGQVAGRLGDGEDFAAVAAEVSLDSAPDGELGCNQASLFVPSFAEAAVAAPLGEIVGPVPTQFGWHLLIVDERRTPTFEELQADPRAFLSDRLVEALWVEWLNATLAAADVEIVPRYGTWTPATPWVLPPDNDTR